MRLDHLPPFSLKIVGLFQAPAIQYAVPGLAWRAAARSSQDKITSMPLDGFIERPSLGMSHLAVQCHMGLVGAFFWLETAIQEPVLQALDQILQGLRLLSGSTPEDSRPGPITEGVDS